MAEEPGPREAERLGQIDPGGFDPHPKRSIDHESVLLGRHEYTPAGFVACDGGRFYPTTPMCWAGSPLYSTTQAAMVSRVCAEPHRGETFVALPPPSGTGGTTLRAIDELQVHPEIRQVCTLSVLRSRSGEDRRTSLFRTGP